MMFYYYLHDILYDKDNDIIFRIILSTFTIKVLS